MADTNEQVNPVSTPLCGRTGDAYHELASPVRMYDVLDSTVIISLTRQEDNHDPQFEPVLKLTEQVEAKTHEEDEDVLFKM